MAREGGIHSVQHLLWPGPGAIRMPASHRTEPKGPCWHKCLETAPQRDLGVAGGVVGKGLGWAELGH